MVTRFYNISLQRRELQGNGACKDPTERIEEFHGMKIDDYILIWNTPKGNRILKSRQT